MKILMLLTKVIVIAVAGLVAIWFFYDYLLLAILSVIAILYVVFYDGSRSKAINSDHFNDHDDGAFSIHNAGTQSNSWDINNSYLHSSELQAYQDD